MSFALLFISEKDPKELGVICKKLGFTVPFQAPYYFTHNVYTNLCVGIHPNWRKFKTAIEYTRFDGDEPSDEYIEMLKQLKENCGPGKFISTSKAKFFKEDKEKLLNANLKVVDIEQKESIVLFDLKFD